MPQIILGLFIAYFLFLLITSILRVAFDVALPVFLGWLAYMICQIPFIKHDLGMARSRFAEFVTLELSSSQPVFKLRNEISVTANHNGSHISVAAAVTVALYWYLSNFNELFLADTKELFFHLHWRYYAAHPEAVDYLYTARFILFCLIAAGLAAAIIGTQKYLYTQLIRYAVQGILLLKVRSLNAQAACLDNFRVEADHNNHLRESCQALSGNAYYNLLSSIQDDLQSILLNTLSLQTLIDTHAVALRSENHKLASLSRKYTLLQDTFDFACREANRAGNEVAFRYLDLVAKAIATFAKLVNQSRWDEFSRQIDGAQNELKRLLENIDQLNSGGNFEAEEEENISDPYAVLGIRADLPNDEIKKIYRNLANIYHPDKHNVRDDKKFKQIQRAWSAICKERGIR